MAATSQSVTKSSHYVSVQQSSSGGTSSRYLAWSVRGRQHYFCSLQGILRIIEIILVLIVLILARVGAKVLTAERRLCLTFPSLRATNSTLD